MNISIKATGIELTESIRQYVNDKVKMLEKFIPADKGAVMMAIEIGKTTSHHKLGDFFRAEINLDWPGANLRTVAETEDLYAAVDVAKDNMAEEVRKFNKKKNTLIKRGGRLLKKLFRG